ncbi:MerR family transcriptional regulator [Paludibacter sp. 221]|uniref:MerR family transcriptional regulator n=1 Tax=Paludibacter sp. 221 TaxID=2302939 RepID=UPI0013D57B80|nr:MerR family transcriptional regulator [Paludibacter sp. 221]NDV46921.1 MerR family transcriptional regulator [Paludibacter sp. 221]
MEKIYYSIAEVADMFKVTQPHLRFLEKEFDKLKPGRTPKGTRQYTKEDIAMLEQIFFLVDQQKLTLDGAKKKLNDKKDMVEKQQQIHKSLTYVKKELKGIARFLNEE